MTTFIVKTPAGARILSFDTEQAARAYLAKFKSADRFQIVRQTIKEEPL